MNDQLTVLIVDDSSLARSMLRSIFESDSRFEVIAEACNGREAIDVIAACHPSLVTMDLEMPEMDGLEAIEHIMGLTPVPILVVSDLTTAERAYAAISCGAVEVTSKPSLIPAEIDRFLEKAQLVAHIRVITHVRALRMQSAPAISAARPSFGLPPENSADVSRPVFAIASSTGGPQALAQILGKLAPNLDCPILVAQHVLPGFAGGMAKWLASVSRLPVKLAEDREPVLPGWVYLSPSETNMTVTENRIALREIGTSEIYRPSCNALFESVATTYARRSVGIVLTGMGSDAITGAQKIRAAGGKTIAQDEASSVVFGMNRAAIACGAIEQILPLQSIAVAMMQIAHAAAGAGRARRHVSA